MFKVNNKDTRIFHFHIPHFPCVPKDEFEPVFASWERYN